MLVKYMVMLVLICCNVLLVQLLWDTHNSEKGPEGWARYLSIIPCHWYVYSLGSTVDYSFSNVGKEIYSEGSAFGHVEKNWGLSFPTGHVWLQAFSSDNTSQVWFLEDVRRSCVFLVFKHEGTQVALL